MESYIELYKQFFLLNPDYKWNDAILLPELVLGGVIDENEEALVASKDLPVQKTVTLFFGILSTKDEMCHVRLINLLRRRKEHRLRSFLEVYFPNVSPQASAGQSGIQDGQVSPIHGNAYPQKPDQGPSSTVSKVPSGTVLADGDQYQNTCTCTAQPLLQQVPKDEEVDDMNRGDAEMKIQQLELMTATTEAIQETITIVVREESLEQLDPLAHTTVSASIPTGCKIKFQAYENDIGICSIRWSPTGRLLGTCGDFGPYTSLTPAHLLKLWKVEEDQVNNWSTFAKCDSSVTCIDFDTAETLVVAGRYDGTISLFSLHDQRLLHSLKHSKYVIATKFMGSSAKIASGAYHDTTVKVWDQTTSTCIQTFCAKSSCTDLVVAEPMDTSVISGHLNHKINFFDTRGPNLQREILMDNGITSLDLSADNRHLLVCTHRSEWHYFDLRTDRVLQCFKADGFEVAFYNSRVILSPDAQFCAAGSFYGKLYIWNVLTGKLENTLDSTPLITACAWHPHSQIVATSARSGTVTIWSADIQTEMQQLELNTAKSEAIQKKEKISIVEPKELFELSDPLDAQTSAVPNGVQGGQISLIHEIAPKHDQGPNNSTVPKVPSGAMLTDADQNQNPGTSTTQPFLQQVPMDEELDESNRGDTPMKMKQLELKTAKNGSIQEKIAIFEPKQSLKQFKPSAHDDVNPSIPRRRKNKFRINTRRRKYEEKIDIGIISWSPTDRILGTDQEPTNNTESKVPSGTMLAEGAYQYHNSGIFTTQLLLQQVPKDKEMNNESNIQMKMQQLELQTSTSEDTKEKITIIKPNEPLKPLNLSAHTRVSASIPTRCKIKFQAHEKQILCICWSPTGRLLGSGRSLRSLHGSTTSPLLKLWKVEDKRVNDWATFAECTSSVSCMDFDQVEMLLVDGRYDGTICIFSLDDQRLLQFLKHSVYEYVSVTKFMGSSTKIVSGAYSESATVKIWDLTTSICTQNFCAYSRCTDLVVAEPMDTSVISGHVNNKILFFDTRSPNPQREIRMDNIITSLDLSYDKRNLLVGTQTNECHYFDLRADRILQTFKADGSKVAFSSCALFSPDAKFCTVGSSFGKLYIWNVLTGKLENTLDSTSGITSCAWHPHGQLIATSGMDGTINIWSNTETMVEEGADQYQDAGTSTYQPFLQQVPVDEEVDDMNRGDIQMKFQQLELNIATTEAIRKKEKISIVEPKELLELSEPLDPQSSSVPNGVQGGQISPIHEIATPSKPDQGPNNSKVPKLPSATIDASGAYQHQNLGTSTSQSLATQEKITMVELEESLEPFDPLAPTSVRASIPIRCKNKFQAYGSEINIMCIRWSPTGRFLGTSGRLRDEDTALLKLWKVEEDLVTNWSILPQCTSQVSCIDFDSAETLLVAGRRDGTISIFSLDFQRFLYSLKHSKYVIATKFMGPSTKIASGANSDSGVKIWDVTTSKCIQTLCADSPCIDLVVAEPIGASVISGHVNNEINFFDARSPNPQKEIRMDNTITSLDLSADKKHLLVCTVANECHYFDLRADRVLQSFKADGSEVDSDYSRAVLSPDAQFCAVGSANGKLYIWNVLTGKMENTLDSTSGITCCAWHPHGELVITSGRDGIVAIWSSDIQTEMEQLELKTATTEAMQEKIPIVESKEPVKPLDLSATTRVSSSIPTVCKNKFQVYERKIGIRSIRWSPTGRFLGAGGGFASHPTPLLKMWKIEDDLSKWDTLDEATSSITCMDFDSAETCVVAGRHDGTVCIFSLDDQRLLHSLKLNEILTATKFMGSTAKIASGALIYDTPIKIWDLTTSKCIQKLCAYSPWWWPNIDGCCTDLVVAEPMSTSVISGHINNKINFFDTRSPNPHRVILLDTGIDSLDLSADNRHLLVCTLRSEWHYFDLRTDRIVQCFKTDGSEVDFYYNRAVLSPDAQFCAAGSPKQCKLYIWNLLTGRLENALNSTVGITSCAWHPLGQQVATSGTDGIVAIWSADIQTEMQQLELNYATTDAIKIKEKISIFEPKELLELSDPMDPQASTVPNGVQGGQISPIHGIVHPPKPDQGPNNSTVPKVPSGTMLTEADENQNPGTSTTQPFLQQVPMDEELDESNRGDSQVKIPQVELKTATTEAIQETITIVDPKKSLKQLDPSARNSVSAKTCHHHQCKRPLSPPPCPMSPPVSAPIPKRCKIKFQVCETEIWIRSIRWSPTGRFLGTCGGTTSPNPALLKLWIIEKDIVTNWATFAQCTRDVISMDFDSAETLVMACNNDGTISIFSLHDQRILHSLQHSNHVQATKFMGSSAKIASGAFSDTAAVKIWDLTTSKCIQTFCTHSYCIDLVVAEPMDSSVISGHLKKEINFFDTRSPNPQREFLMDNHITSLDLSADKRNLLVCTERSEWYYFDLRANRILQSFKPDGSTVIFRYSPAVLSPDAQFCAVNSGNGELYIWDLLTGKMENILDVPRGGYHCAWHPHGQLVATSGKNGTVAIRAAERRQCEIQ